VTITVIEPGPLTSVQDPIGRPGWRRYGVPVGGAADRWSALLANRLVGNDDAAALLEVTLGGAVVRVDRAAVVAATGGLGATVDGRPLPINAGTRVRAGATVRLVHGSGARGYLAVNGGIGVEAVLGSSSTDLRTGFGGHDGRALRAGDRLALAPSNGRPARWDPEAASGPIRVVAGPHPESLGALLGREWTTGIEADRAGVRLDGERIGGSGEIASMGLPLGAIQVPPDGRPIVMLADRPVTGGYPVPACVIGADVGRVAQLLPGDAVRFASVSIQEAREALRLAEARLMALEPADDDLLGWVGAHD
jgi:biotin-dependent carboxylase-like uncharacterized protein